MISSGQPEVARFCYLRKNLSKRSNLARHLATSIHIKFFDTIKCRGLRINWQEVYIGRYLTYRCCRTNKTLVWWCRDMWQPTYDMGASDLRQFTRETNSLNMSTTLTTTTNLLTGTSMRTTGGRRDGAHGIMDLK